MKIRYNNEMRRSDREIKDILQIKAFIQKESIMRIGFYDEGEVFIVPVNYGYIFENEKHVFYFHGAKAGRKYELAKKAPDVGFEIDGNYELLEADTACDYSAKFQSVIGNGRLSLVENQEEKIKDLNILMKQSTGKAAWTYENKMLDGVAVFKLEVEKLSCKAK